MHNISVFNWLALLVGLALIVFGLFDRKPKPVKARAPVIFQHSILRRKLTGALFGDHAAADRLIVHEMKKRPGTSYCEAAQAALDILERDRSRI